MADPQAVANHLGRALNRPICVDDTQLRILAYTSAPAGDDEARRFSILNRTVSDDVRDWIAQHAAKGPEPGFIVPARPEIGLEFDRWVAIARAEGRAVAYIWVLVEAGELDSVEQELLGAAAREIGEFVGRQHLIDELRSLREREGIDELLNENPAVRRQAAHRLAETELFDPSADISAIVLLPSPDQDTADAHTAVRSVIERSLDEIRMALPRGGLLASRRSSHGLLIISSSSLQKPSAGAADLAHDILQRNLGNGGEAWVGVSGPRADVTEAAAAYDEARRAAEVAAVLRSLGPVAHFDQIGIYRRVATMIDDASDAVSIHPSIQRLLDREHGGDELARTLEVYLDSAGDAAESARQLHVHRASLYGRLRRIESLTGLDLSDGQDRLAAHLELKVARLGRQHPGHRS